MDANEREPSDREREFNRLVERAKEIFARERDEVIGIHAMELGQVFGIIRKMPIIPNANTVIKPQRRIGRMARIRCN